MRSGRGRHGFRCYILYYFQFELYYYSVSRSVVQYTLLSENIVFRRRLLSFNFASERVQRLFYVLRVPTAKFSTNRNNNYITI